MPKFMTWFSDFLETSCFFIAFICVMTHLNVLTCALKQIGPFVPKNGCHCRLFEPERQDAFGFLGRELSKSIRISYKN